MTDRRRLGPMEVRLLTGFLVVSLTALGVLLMGTVIPHLLARTGHGEAVDTRWLVMASVVALLTAIVASVLATRRLLAPIELALTTAKAFAAGDHSARVPDLGRPELVELVDALNAAAGQVERSELDRQRHTADIAHELRTPLTALQAGLEELRDGLVPASHARLAALHDQASRLGRVVNDLAELSAVESPGLQLTLDHVDLAEVAEDAVAARAGAMSAAALTWRTELDPGVVVGADADRLHQVIGNLLANCTAYCRAGDTVVVRVRADDQRGVLEVADSGPGLSEEERTHVFDRSWRGSGGRTRPGSGLGLPITRALVVAQRGEVELTSGVDQGTSVRIILPLAR